MKKFQWRNIVSHTILILGSALMVLPIYIAFVSSTYDLSQNLKGLPFWPGPFLLDNYTQVIFEGVSSQGLPPIGPMILNSFIVALSITFGKISISLISAFSITYFNFKFRSFAFWIIFATLMLPVEVRILPTYEVVASLNLLNSYTGLSLPLIASATATFLYRQLFMTIPDELAEAAKIDGAGPMHFLYYILIPMSKTNIAALFVITFIYGWNQYLWPLLITKDVSFYTIIMGIQRMARASDFQPQWHLVMSTVILALIPPIIVIIVMQKQFVKGLFEVEK